MLAKLVVWAETRPAAIARLRRALLEYRIGGIRTTLPLFLEITAEQGFIDGEIDTGYLERLLASRAAAEPPADGGDGLESDLAAAAAALHYRMNAPKPATQAAGGSAWKRAGRAAGLR
jgi:acetyl-CoA carboxylase biotin carboxylase subunit